MAAKIRFYKNSFQILKPWKKFASFRSRRLSYFSLTQLFKRVHQVLDSQCLQVQYLFVKFPKGQERTWPFLPGQGGTSVSSSNCWSLKLQRIVFRSFKRFKGERANDTKNGNAKLLNKLQPTNPGFSLVLSH